MDSAEAWKQLFENWPSTIPRRGTLITVFNEPIAFVGYLMSGNLLLLDRDKPDTIGARKVIVAYSTIAAIKITDVLELSRYQVMGFQPPM